MLIRTKILEILVAEDEQFTFSSVEGKFIKACFAELGNLNTGNLGSEVRADMVDFCVGTQEIRLLRVGTQTRVSVFCSYRSGFGCLELDRSERTEEFSGRELLVHVPIRVVEWI